MASIAVQSGLQLYLKQMLLIRWRRWLTERYLRAWLTDAELRRRLRQAARARRESLLRWSTTATILVGVLAGVTG